MRIAPRLIIFETDRLAVEALRRDVRLPFIGVVHGDGRQATREADLDALWLTWMQAERFGVTPTVQLHCAVVYRTPPPLTAEGYPAFIVAGVGFSKSDPPDLVERLRMSIEAVLEAIKRFNSSGGGPIIRVGTIPENLLLDGLPLATATATIAKAWEKLYGE